MIFRDKAGGKPYNKLPEEKVYRLKKQIAEKTGTEMAATAVIRESGLTLYSNCFFCGLERDGSIRGGRDYEQSTGFEYCIFMR